MAIIPVTVTAQGVEVFHAERDHGGVVPWADVRFGTRYQGGRGEDDRDVLVLPCPAGCGSETTHPDGDSAPDMVREVFAELRSRIPEGPRPPTPEETDNETIKALVVQAAQGAVGISLTALSAGQVRALLAILLWKAGAVNPDGTVRPLAQWAR